MSYLVSEFLINPVIRQARRFSSGFATAAAPDHDIITSCSASLPPGHQWRSAVIEEDDPKPEDTTDEISIAAPNNMVAVEQLPAPAQLEESSDPGRGPVAADDLPTSHANLYPQDTMAQDTEVLTPPTRSPDVSTSTPSTTSNPLPEDDGMGLLRSRIIAIQALDLPQDEKAALMHHLLMEGYNRSQVRVAVSGVGAKLRPESKYMWEQALATGPLESYKFWNHLGEGLGGLSLKVSLSEDDLRPTFVPVKEGEEEEEEGEGGGAGVRPLGCEHYRRNVKMQCATCERWYTCRLCHDAVEDHQLPRKETVHMLCMVCGCAQKVGDACIKCGTAAARYYCGVCKLWNDDPDKSIYHCNDCGICRVGQGLGKDFFHCNVSFPLITLTLTAEGGERGP
ncbi:zf-CHY-domain-containing protein [Coniochaeta sp. PMI_546]|nr:zf-CHY-domain-containing protein [Coniochaeta sp. PMI_546]